MSILEAEQYFAQQFQKDLQQLGAQTLAKYATIVQTYNRIIIPFERLRAQDYQSIFDNSQLITTIQQLQAENYQLRQNFKSEIDHKNGVISQLKKDNQITLEKCHLKESEYNLVLADCTRDKNTLAERLSQLKQKQLRMLEREKVLEEQQFYLRKQWELFQEKDRSTQQVFKNKCKLTRIYSQANITRKGLNPFKKTLQDHAYEKCAKQEQSHHQVLKNPLRKLVKHHKAEIYDMSFNYDGTLLATCAADNHIKIYDTSLLKTVQAITNYQATCFTTIALDHAGERLLAGSTDKTVSLYHCQSGKQLQSLIGHSDTVNSVSWTDNQKFVSGSDDKQLKLWDLEKRSKVLSFDCQRTVKVVKSNQLQPVVYTGHGDGSIRAYSPSQSNPITQIKGVINYSITSLTLLSNRHQILATSTEGSAVYLLDLKMSKVVRKYENERFYNSAARAAISPSESLLLAGNCDGAIYYWERCEGHFAGKISGHDGVLNVLEYHQTSKTLATADKQGSLILWQ